MRAIVVKAPLLPSVWLRESKPRMLIGVEASTGREFAFFEWEVDATTVGTWKRHAEAHGRPS